MDWLKVVVGFVLIFGAVTVWYRLLRNLKGGGGARPDLPRRGKRSEIQPNELERIIAAHRSAPPVQPMTRAPQSPATARSTGGAPIAAGPPAAAAAGPALRGPVPRPLLSGPHKLVYGLLKSVLPEYTVFPFVPLGLVAPSAASSSHVLALVVCRPDLTVAAAVDVVPAGSVASPAVVQALGAAGIRHLSIDPRALPRRESIRQLVHGT